MLDLVKLLKELSELPNYRGVFYSEADFKFQLGWKIKEKYPDIDIFFEKPYNNGRIDIVVLKDRNIIPIELKYITLPVIGFECLGRHNDNWLVFNILEDIQRNEQFIIEKESKAGYVILITNNPFYWRGSSRRTKVSNFLINTERRKIPNGVLEWINVKNSNDPRTRKSITLNQTYEINWKEYLVLKDDNNNILNNGEFKYIILKSNNNE